MNAAFSSVFAPFAEVTPAEYTRATQVTYLGYVYCTMAVLKRMLPRDSGAIVHVGSALAYRGIPLQSAYCGAKHAIRGFSESLRCELLHDGSGVRSTMVQLPALNTPQFTWLLALSWAASCCAEKHDRNTRERKIMPQGKNSRLKDPELYEKLRDEGNSKEKSARIANSAGTSSRSSTGRKGGKAGSYDDWTVPELKDRARELGLSGYSKKNKGELIAALRNH